jgi:hypothetical protein
VHIRARCIALPVVKLRRLGALVPVTKIMGSCFENEDGAHNLQYDAYHIFTVIRLPLQS